jgi:hypothetical protein
MSVFNLFCIAVDRLIAIAWPLHYPSIVTRKRVCYIKTPGVFLLSALSFLPLFGVNVWDDEVGCFPMYVFTEAHTIGDALFVFILLCVTMGIYVYIFLVAKSHFERIVREERLQNNQGHRPSLKDLKAAKMLLLIVTIFVVCWGLGFCIMGAVISNHGYNSTLILLDSFGYCLILLSSALNPLIYTFRPLIYTFRSPEFRLAFDRLLRVRRRVNDQAGDRSTTGVSVSPSL